MSDYFLGQTNLRIMVSTNQTLSGAALKLKYKKPNGDTGEFSCTIDGSDDTKMYYDIESEDIDIPGEWLFWSHITFADSKVGIGEIARVIFKREGND